MKFQLASDFHLERYKKLPEITKLITPSAPYLILAGDICNVKHPHFFEFFNKICPLFTKIFYVLGNHEYYCNDMMPEFYSMSETEEYARNILNNFNNVYLLQKDFIELGNKIIIMGATLWTYLSKKDIFKPVGTCLLPNTDYILYNDHIMLHPKLTNKTHLTHKRWLEYMLECFQKKKIIVITHHLPSKKCLNSKYEFNIMNKTFYSNSEKILERATVWCAGRTHIGVNKEIQGTLVCANPLGYLWEKNNYCNSFTFHVF